MARTTLNDREREMWVQNDEGLYNWWRSTRLPMREFVRQNRVELDEAIQRALATPPERDWRYYARMGDKKEGGLRRYAHPGKFEGELHIAQYVWGLTMEGWGEGAGDVSEIGFYATAVGLGGDEAVEAVERLAKEDGDVLTAEERKLIKESAGAIVRESDQGFVSVKFHDKEKDFDKAWKEIEDEVEEFYEGQEGEEGAEMGVHGRPLSRPRIEEIKRLKTVSAKTLQESRELLDIIEDAANLSDGTLATLTGLRNYEDLANVQADFVAYIRALGPHRNWGSWIDAWRDFEAYEGKGR